MKASRKKEIVNTRVEISEIEHRKVVEKVSETNSQFSEINKTDKSLDRPRKRKENLNY